MRISPVVWRTTLWLSLGGWVGSWAFFAFVVSRVAFRILPGDVAGDLAGRLLETLHFGGAALALAAAGSAWLLGRRGLLIGLPVVFAAVFAASELWLSPTIPPVPPNATGEAASEASSLRFARLHALSLGLFLAVHLASIGLVVLHARRDVRLERDPSAALPRP
ncbi:MAG: DUF4149 domain-containing protein [bacterium]